MTISVENLKLTTYDPAEDLTTDAARAIFLDEALKTNDLLYIQHALEVSGRAEKISRITT